MSELCVQRKYCDKRLHVTLLLVVTCLIFGNSLLNGFVWDDNLIILGKEVYKKFDIGRMFFSPANGLEYLPLRDLTYALDYLLWGENPAGYHFANLTFYCANVVAVYHTTRQINALLFKNQEGINFSFSQAAFLTALMFALHPIHSEAVSFIICRNVQLSGLFFFGACYFYLRFVNETFERHWGYYFAAFICFLFALFSKATTIIFPAIAFLITVFSPRQKELRSYIALLPFIPLSAIFYFVFKMVGYQTGMINEQLLRFGSSNIMARVVVALQIPTFYLRKLFFPAALSAEYDVKFATSFADPAVAMAGGLLFFLFVATFVMRKKRPHLFFSFCWFLIALIPVLNFLPTNPVVADRYVYLSSFAFCYALAVSAIMLTRQTRKYCVPMGGVVLVVWASLAFQRNALWKDNKTLFEATVKISPDASTAYINLGNEYLRENNYERAQNAYSHVERILPTSAYKEYAKGYEFYQLGDYSHAIASFKAALAKRESFIDALYYLGRASEETGDVKSAIKYYNNLILSKELDPSGFFRSSATERRRKLLEVLSPQIDALRKKVVASPWEIQSREELALVLDSFGLYDEALENYLVLEKLGDRKWQLFYNTANVFKKKERYREAADYYEKSLALNPDYADALNNLGLVYRDMHEYDLAIDAYKKAMASNPYYAFAPFNLAVVYFHMGDKANAIRYFRYTGERFPSLKIQTVPYLRELQ